MKIDLSALKDQNTTLPGLAMICITILILAGKIDVMMLVQKLPWDKIIAFLFGGGGIALLGANTKALPVSVATQVIQQVESILKPPDSEAQG